MKKSILALMLSLAVGQTIAQTPPKSIPKSSVTIETLVKQHDKMRGITWYQHKTSPTFRNRNGVFVYFGKQDNGQILPLRFVMQYHSSNWLFIEKAWAKVDGVTINLPQKKSSFGWERDNGGGNIWEWSDTHIDDYSLNTIKQFASGKSVTIRFEGRQYHDDRNITESQLKAMREVISVYETLIKK